MSIIPAADVNILELEELLRPWLFAPQEWCIRWEETTGEPLPVLEGPDGAEVWQA